MAKQLPEVVVRGKLENPLLATHFLDYFIISRFFFLLFYVLINFYKNYFIIIIL